MNDITDCEARLTALRARKQKSAENVLGEAAERAQCKHNIQIVDELIVAAEKKLRAAQHKMEVREGREIAQEENVGYTQCN
jgi:hypothetical protein